MKQTVVPRTVETYFSNIFLLHFGSTNPCRITRKEFLMKQTKMYVCTLEQFILVDIWIHCCASWNWICIGNAVVYIQSTMEEKCEKWSIDMWGLIELQLHEKLSLMRTKLWSVIPLFAVLLTGGVNGNLCEHLAHQTAGGTIECHSCN